ncbi:telomere-associated protein Tap [Streptomyces sp. G45]|uniref:telomere-associated protein Tap n=1 Tax=Streptomyces sp. G45 TaxID=3406627 RepID=UPI003C244173
MGEDRPRLLLMKAHLVWDLDTPPETGGTDGGPGGGDGGTPPSTGPGDSEGTSSPGNSLANYAEKNGDNGDNGDSAGQSPAAALFEVIAAKNGDSAGQSRFSIPGQTAAPNGDNALTSTVTVVTVPTPANGDRNGDTLAAAPNGDNALTSTVTVPGSTAPAQLSTGDNALTSTVTVPPANGPEEDMALSTEPVTLSFGLPSLDTAAPRLTGGTTTVIAGAPGAGASLLALAMARTTVLTHQRPVLYAASGPTRDDVIGRMVAAQAGLDYQQLRAGTLPLDQQTAAQQTAAGLGWPLLVDSSANLTAQDISDLAADINSDGLALVVVDRLQHEHADHLPLSGDALPDAARALSATAERLGVPVLLVVDTDDPAVLDTLAADLTLTVTRDGQDVAVAIKQRDGEPASVQLHADLACARLTERPEPAPTPSPRPAPESTEPARPTDTKTETTETTEAPATDATYPNGPLAVLDVTGDGQVLAHLVDGRTTEAPATDATYPNGPLAVLDVTGDGQVLAHLVDGRTMDCPARSITTLVKWALNAGLGAKRLHKWGTDGDPMVILTAAATKKFGLPDTLEDVRHQRLPDNHKVVKAIAKSGFELTKRGFSPWTRIYKPIDKEKGGDRACVQIGIVPWDALGAKSGWYIDEDTPAADIARTLGIYTQRVISPRGTMGSSGLELMLQLRPATKPVWSEEEQKWVPGKIEEHLHRTVKAVPCEANGNHPVVFETWPNGERPAEEFMREEAWSWHRDATAEEAATFAYVIGIDTNTSFLSSSSRLLVGGNADPVHHVAPAFNPKIPGAWKVDFSRAHLDIEVPDGKPNPLDPRLPSPFTNTGEPPAGPRWYTTQTCDYARKMGIKVEPIEAWLREPLGSGWLDPWNERLATAYKTTMANLGLGLTEDMPMEDFLAAMERLAAGEGDPIERTVLKAIKQTVKSGVGKLAQTPSYIPGYRPGEPWSEMTKFWWRPDIRAAVISTARIVQHRKIVKTLALTGRAPLATYSDCVVYPAHTTNPLEVIRSDAAPTVIKGAFNFGVRPGYAKLEGIRDFDWYRQMQADGLNAAKKIAPRDGERVDEGE